MRIGMDVGSTTLKCVALDDKYNIVYKAYERHYSKIAEKSAMMLSQIVDEHPEFKNASLTVSGSAGMGFAQSLGLDFIQEVYATRVGVSRLLPGTDAVIELGGEDEQKGDSESAELMQFVKETLGDKIKEAKVSHRLKTHPVCLTAGEGFSFEMEKYFKNFQMPEPIKAERILELNVEHPAVKAMAAALATDRDKAALYARILYDQANLIAGLPLEDPSAYTDMVAQLMQ